MLRSGVGWLGRESTGHQPVPASSTVQLFTPGRRLRTRAQRRCSFFWNGPAERENCVPQLCRRDDLQAGGDSGHDGLQAFIPIMTDMAVIKRHERWQR